MIVICLLQADKYTKGSVANRDRIYAQLGKRSKGIVISRSPDQNGTGTQFPQLKFDSEFFVMYSYGLMEAGNYYLVREYEHGPIQLFQILMHSDRCLLFQRYGIPTELEWRMRNDPLHEIIECLSEEQVKQWQYCFRSYEDAHLRSEDADEEED